MDVLGSLDDFRVTMTLLKCFETDDGFFGGNEDELTVTMACGDQKASSSHKMEAGMFEEETCPNRGIGGLWLSKIWSMALHCKNGDAVRIGITEQDDFSPEDGGSNRISWENIQMLLPMTPVTLSVSVGSKHWWDKFGDWYLDNIGLCVTDAIPFFNKVKKLGFNKAARKFMKKQAKAIVKEGVRQQIEGSGNEEEVGEDFTVDQYMESFDKATCLQRNNGQYQVRLEFFGSADTCRCTLALFVIFAFSMNQIFI